MGGWYPSLVVNLRLRFDERYTAIETPAPVTVADYVARLAVPEQRATVRPLILEGGANNLSVVASLVPKSASVEIPSYRQAGKFSLTFDFRALPLDPRLIRACGVEVHLGAVDAANFATGMTRVEADGTRLSVLRTSADTQLMVGLVDEWSVEHSERSSEVHLEGRDLRGLLLDTTIAPAMLQKLDLRKNIVEVVRQIVGFHPFGGRVRVLANVQDWPSQRIPSPASADGVTRVRLGSDGKAPAAGASGGDANKVKFWDLITQYCFLVGAVPYFQGQQLVVRPARSLYEHQKNAVDPSFDTPFLAGLPREVEIGNPPTRERLTMRRMVYGRDIGSFKFSRKMAGAAKTPVIEVVSLDTSSKQRGAGRLLTAQWPQPTQTAARTTSVSPSGNASQTDVMRIPVPGITDKKQLLEIARNLHEEIARGEMGGTCNTPHMASFGGDNSDPDLVRLRQGDPCEFYVDASRLASRSPIVAELVENQRRSFAEQVVVVQQRLNCDGNTARAIVASARGAVAELQAAFRVTGVRYDWQVRGLQIAFDFQNYLESRSAVGDTTGANLVPAVQAVAPHRSAA